MTENIEYQYRSSRAGHHHAYLLPALDRIVGEIKPDRVFDLGCGNGSVGAHLSGGRREIVGVDPSESAVQIANDSYPHLRIKLGSAYDDLPAKYGTFPMVISLEVVRSAALREKSVRTPGTQRHRCCLDSLPWILEERSVGAQWQNGCAFHSALGWGPYQILVDPNFISAADRGRS